jgi:endonuclease/exonuclease/phosphatase family metal-dependent hydrolase
MVKWIRKFNLWVIFFTLIAYIAPFVKPSEVSFLMFVGVSYPWLLLLNFIFIIIWSVSRYHYWWYSAACILLGFGYLMTVLGINIFKTKTSNTTDIKILTFNTYGLVLSKFKNKTEGYRLVNIFFEKQDADVICMQEAPWGYEDMLRQTRVPFLTNNYPYKFRADSTGLAYYSKYPITFASQVPINKNGANGCAFADIAFKDKTVRIFNMQLQSNEVSDRIDKLADKGELSDKSSWLGFIKILKHFRRAAIIREKEAEIVKKYMIDSPNPVILCGDMNDIPVSYTYRILSKNLKDSFKKQGWGTGTTYAGKIPALRIDYVLTDKKMTPLSCKILREPFSDHYPVSAIIRLNF